MADDELLGKLRICPRCGELTEEGDHFPLVDDSAYHVLCYQATMIEAGEGDPFPKCDYCGQIIWKHEGGQLVMVVRDKVVEGGEWRDARWHPECAPASKVEAPDRIDHPPKQPTPRSDLRLKDLIEAKVNGDDPVPAMPYCARCDKPVRRAKLTFDGKDYHALCAQKAGMPVTERKRCEVCKRKIRPEALVECDAEGGVTLYYDRACYRTACLEAGMEDPFPFSTRKHRRKLTTARPPREPKSPKQPKVETRVCSFCKKTVLREDFRDHVAQHEAEDWDGSKRRRAQG